MQEYCQYVPDDKHVKLMGKACVFPLSKIIPGYVRRKSLEYLRGKGYTTERWTKRQAAQSYASLDNLLGYKKYFFSNEYPGFLDAIVFGHVVKAMQYSLLRRRVEKYPRLIRHCERIAKEFFSDKESLQKFVDTLAEDRKTPRLEDEALYHCPTRELNDNLFEQEWFIKSNAKPSKKGSRFRVVRKAEKYLPTVLFVGFLGLTAYLTKRGLSGA